MFVTRCSHCRVDRIPTNCGDLNAVASFEIRRRDFPSFPPKTKIRTKVPFHSTDQKYHVDFQSKAFHVNWKLILSGSSFPDRNRKLNSFLLSLINLDDRVKRSTFHDRSVSEISFLSKTKHVETIGANAVGERGEERERGENRS